MTFATWSTSRWYRPSGLYTDQDRNADRIKYFGDKMKTARILINPSTQGGIGDPVQLRAGPVPDPGLRLLEW